MSRRTLRLLLPAGLALAIGACDKYPTRPTNRRPTISSVVAFPTTLGLGDSTLVTVIATDPDGDTLVYDWHTSNGLATPGEHYGSLYHTSSRSRVFYLAWRPVNYDTAYLWCGVRDVKGGGDEKRIRILLRDP